LTLKGQNYIFSWTTILFHAPAIYRSPESAIYFFLIAS
jgi:hypothetical protein